MADNSDLIVELGDYLDHLEMVSIHLGTANTNGIYRQ